MDKDKKKIIFLSLMCLQLAIVFEIIWFVVHYCIDLVNTGTSLNRDISFINMFPFGIGVCFALGFTINGLKRIYWDNIDIKENKGLIAKVMFLALSPVLVGVLYSVVIGEIVKKPVIDIISNSTNKWVVFHIWGIYLVFVGFFTFYIPCKIAKLIVKIISSVEEKIDNKLNINN